MKLILVEVVEPTIAMKHSDWSRHCRLELEDLVLASPGSHSVHNGRQEALVSGNFGSTTLDSAMSSSLRKRIEKGDERASLRPSPGAPTSC